MEVEAFSWKCGVLYFCLASKTLNSKLKYSTSVIYMANFCFESTLLLLPETSIVGHTHSREMHKITYSRKFDKLYEVPQDAQALNTYLRALVIFLDQAYQNCLCLLDKHRL